MLKRIFGIDNGGDDLEFYWTTATFPIKERNECSCTIKKASGEDTKFEVPLPGVKKDTVKLEVIDGKIKVTWKRGEKDYKELLIPPPKSDLDGLKAKLEDGMLYITIPSIKPISKEIVIE